MKKGLCWKGPVWTFSDPWLKVLGLGRGISVTMFAHLWVSLEADMLAVLPLVEDSASVIYGPSLY